MAIAIDRFMDIFNRTRGRVRYKLGAKPALGLAPDKVTVSDCSGYMRYIFDQCGLWLPDGSYSQYMYIRDRLRWPMVVYNNLKYTVGDPHRLFIAFKMPVQRPDGTLSHGHVWCVYMGNTIECYSPRGVGSRRYTALAKIVDRCFEVPTR